MSRTAVNKARGFVTALQQLRGLPTHLLKLNTIEKTVRLATREAYEHCRAFESSQQTAASSWIAVFAVGFFAADAHGMPLEHSVDVVFVLLIRDNL